MKKDTRSAYRSRAANTERLVDASVAAVKAERDERFETARADYADRNKPIPFTDEQYAAARVVRTRFGWHEVVRVNAQSVTVKTPYSWTDRILRKKILEVN
jgi:hypothetical protein